MTKLLVIKLAGIGDFILSLPALKHLSSECEGEISFLCAERVKGLAERSPYFKEVFSLREPFFSLRTIFSNLNKLLFLRKKEFDLSINLHETGSLRGLITLRLLFFILGSKKSVHLKKSGKKDGGEIIKHLEFVESLTETPAGFAAPELPLLREDEKRIDHLLAEERIDTSHRMVGLQPGGNKKNFLWPVSHFATVAQHLHKQYGATILVTGDPRDWKLAEALQHKVDFPIKNFCGLLPLELVPSFLRRLHLFISNDTGLAHIAGAVRTPLVVIFGPYSQKRFYPFYEDQKGVVIHREDVSSISEISSQEVIQKIDTFLEKNK